MSQLSPSDNDNEVAKLPRPPLNNQGQNKLEKISDQPKFRSDSAALPGFLLQLRNMLTINADRFLNEYSKVYYVANHLEEDALQVIISNINDTEEPTIATTTAFIKIFKTSFRDSDTKSPALRALTTLRQGK